MDPNEPKNGLHHNANDAESVRDSNNVDEHMIRELEQELIPHMERFTVAAPGLQDTETMLSRLLPIFQQRLGSAIQANFYNELKAPEVQKDPFAGLVSSSVSPSIGRLLRLQLHVYPKGFLLAAGALFVLLNVMMYINNIEFMFASELFALSIPMFRIVGAWFGYRSNNTGLRQMEQVTPYPPVLQFMARVFLVFSVSITLGLMSALIVALTSSQVSVLGFVWGWLAPVSLIFGILMYVTYRRGAAAAILFSLVVWVVYMLLTQSYWAQVIPEFTRILTVVSFVIGALLIVGCLLKFAQDPAFLSWKAGQI